MADAAPLDVLHVVPYFEDAWAYGGIPRAAAGMVRGLLARGHRVTVSTTDACDAASRLAPGIRREGALSVHVFPNRSNRLAYRFQLFTPRGLRSHLARTAGAVRIAHLHGCHHLPGALAAHALRRAGVPYVLSPHGTAPRIERRRLAKLLFDKTLGRGVLSGAARVLATSAAEDRALAALGVAAPRRARLPSPLDVDEHETMPERGSFRSRHGLGAAPVVAYLGTFTPRKEVATLVRACSALAEGVRLVLAGNDLGAGAELRRALATSARADAIVMPGLLRGRERLAALVDADVVAYATRDEVFGLVPLEALLCGTPVVVGNDSGCGEVIGDVGGGVAVTPGDPSALAGALAAMLADVAAWRLRAGEAAVRVRERYSRAAVAERLEGIYAQVLAEAAGPARDGR
jgi:glycosyltransferase involved in cell wall biosynthesis